MTSGTSPEERVARVARMWDAYNAGELETRERERIELDADG